ncbi:MAG TPA: hypothetical protein VEU06_01185 [Micropepsaceae bacterium]|nr:hypothetical protein [Micropepsaceae bacterium]
MLQSIANMRTLADLCKSHEPLPEPLASWLAESLESFLDQKSPSLNEAFGVRNARGGVPWRMEASIRARDAALRTLAETHLRNLSPSAQAEAIHRLSCRYGASGWRFDKEKDEMPASYRGGPHEFLWRAFRSGAVMPLCTRQLRTILGS